MAPDEHIQPQLDFDYDGKRDRWNGIDIEDHQRKVKDDFEMLDEVGM